MIGSTRKHIKRWRNQQLVDRIFKLVEAEKYVYNFQCVVVIC
uniref:Uncharacterized protein n=1 Tax=Tetranychus urticae TaxID=32264 RepID=T1KZI0_TETUR